MSKRLKLLLIILIPIICLVIAGIPFTLADYPETQTEQTMNGTSAENTGASTADKSFKGGALYISNGASYTMTGGSIAGKTNQYGGAVYVTNGSTFTMTGGTITGCSALYGGAIYVESGGTCNITGGTITGNKAQFAPAIYVEDGGILNVDQTATIKDNEYEKYGNPLEIYVDGALAKTMYMKEDTYTISEADMPLQYENCCGYFLDEKLSQCSFGEVALTSEAKGFASRTADAEKYIARLYTRTADPDNFTFTEDTTKGTYDIKAKDTTISGHIVLPKEYMNTQTSIFSASNYTSGAFYNCRKMTGITFQEGLEIIGQFSFYTRNSLVGELIIPDSVTSIETKAFVGCNKLTGSLIIPNSVTSIGYYVFQDCTGFTEGLIIPNSMTSLENGVFYKCSGFTSLTIPDGVISIGDFVFFECAGLFGNLTIPDSVKNIGDSAFEGCSGLTGNLIISKNVTNIVNSAFSGCTGFTSVSISSENRTYKDNGKNVIVEKSTNTIIQGFNCTNLSVLEEITSIGYSSFSGCSGLVGFLTIQDTVTSIGNYAFQNCSGLTGMIIGKKTKTIGSNVFAGCSGLLSAYIPSSVTTLNASPSDYYSPFRECSSSLVIYTDVANASSKPSGWGKYWNYYSSGKKLTVNYGYTLEQYKAAVGLTFAPNEEKINRVEVETIEVDVYQVDNSYLQDVVINKNEYIAILKENEKIA